MVFTPLSIRRGVGGEAVLYLQTMVFTPLSIRRGGGGEAVDGLVVSLLLGWCKALVGLFDSVMWVYRNAKLAYYLHFYSKEKCNL